MNCTRNDVAAPRAGWRPGPLAALVLLCGACTDEPRIDPATLAGQEVPTELQRGAGLYTAHCLPCHGEYGLGSPTGPPLVHPVYREGHHGDEAFQLAVQQGVRAHHWRFGDMAAVPGLTRADVEAVTGYIRWLQRQAGIQ